MCEIEEIFAAFIEKEIELLFAAKLVKRLVRDTEPDKIFDTLIGFFPLNTVSSLAFLSLYKLYKSLVKTFNKGNSAHKGEVDKANVLLEKAYRLVEQKEELLSNVIAELDTVTSQLNEERKLRSQKARQKTEMPPSQFEEKSLLTDEIHKVLSEDRDLTSSRLADSIRKETAQSYRIREELIRVQHRYEEAEAELRALRQKIRSLVMLVNATVGIVQKSKCKNFQTFVKQLIAIIRGEEPTNVEWANPEVKIATCPEAFVTLLRDQITRVEQQAEKLLCDNSRLRQKIKSQNQSQQRQPATTSKEETSIEEVKRTREDRKACLFKKFLNLKIKDD